MEAVYAIRKTMINASGKAQHILMTDGHSEVFETHDYEEVKRMVEILNSNTDSGWKYEAIKIMK